RAMVRYAKQHSFTFLDLDQFESVTGQGLQARRGSEVCRLGRRDWLEPGAHAKTIRAVAPIAAGFSEVWVIQGDLLGRIVLRDDIRPQAGAVIDQLRGEGLRTVVLTGDRHATAEHLKTQLHLDEICSELNPEQKV